MVFKACIPELAGLAFYLDEMPEMSQPGFVPRVKIPSLMLNGRYDPFFTVESSINPLYDLLGTPSKDKKLILYDTDHYIPYKDLVKETLDWLDKYLGQTKSREFR
jgi:hypothetical protein